ncbi:MAG: GNAT family N-acetyltransferase [Acidobacteriota bacterium]
MSSIDDHPHSDFRSAPTAASPAPMPPPSLPEGVRLRAAVESDLPVILDFIQQLAAYEGLEAMCVVTADDLRGTLFPEPLSTGPIYAEAVLAEEKRGAEGEESWAAVGFAVFNHNYSTFLGRPGLWLEDLYVHPSQRGRGLGKALLQHLAQVALERGCGRMEWWVVSWNDSARRFYESLQARAMSEWVVYRLAGETLDNMARFGGPPEGQSTPGPEEGALRLPEGVRLRDATVEDVPVILRFIEELADYERLRHECVATEEHLHRTLFGDRAYAHVVLAEREEADHQEDGDWRPVGFALYFHSYSAYLGRPGLWLEDVYVPKSERGQGLGKALLQRLAQIAVERRCGRMEWWVLDWNEPSIRFYESLEAEAMKDLVVYRLTGPTLEDMARYGGEPQS